MKEGVYFSIYQDTQLELVYQHSFVLRMNGSLAKTAGTIDFCLTNVKLKYSDEILTTADEMC